VVVGLVFVGMVRVAMRADWVVKADAELTPSTYGIGNAFLTDYLLPFEIASLVLLVALIGAVVVSRKEVRS
jgi:NADH-quinone oxidoreductase subunit J